MTKSELKKLIKPIVEQCVNEVLLEGGILSSVISEVVVGLGVQKTLTEQVSTNEARTQATQQDDHQVQRKLQETRSRMMEAIGKDAYAGVDLLQIFKFSSRCKLFVLSPPQTGTARSVTKSLYVFGTRSM